MPVRAQSDSVQWMRERWEAHGEPHPAQFAAMASVLRTSVLMTDELDRVLKACGLSRTGYLVMITLQMSDEATRPLGQLGKALLIHPTTVTMVIDQLEKSALVRRQPHPTDRRTVLAQLTPKGHAAAERATAALAEIGFGLDGITDSAADRLVADLRKIRQGLQDFG
jgi:DNA-binding MarR family transcriptional regulator